MSAKIRTIMLVSLVTALIWLWAEGESLSTLPLNPRIVFVHDNELDLETQPDWPGTIRLRLQGSTRGLSDADHLLGTEIRLKLGQPGVPALPGEGRVINLEEAISQLPEIRSAGLSVQEVTPPTTVVTIVKLVSRELPVRVSMPTDIDLLGEATVSPARVTVRLPEQLAARLAPDANAVAALTRADLGNARDDAPQTLSTAVRLPGPLQGEAGVTITPEKVNVTFRLKRSVDSITVASLPVWFSLPPTEGTGWDIELVDQFLRDVTFTGPTDAIAKIRSREIIPIAEVRLSSDDLEKAVETKEAQFVALPAGVESGVAVKTVRLKITRRKLESEDNPPGLNIPEPRPTGKPD